MTQHQGIVHMHQAPIVADYCTQYEPINPFFSEMWQQTHNLYEIMAIQKAAVAGEEASYMYLKNNPEFVFRGGGAELSKFGVHYVMNILCL